MALQGFDERRRPAALNLAPTLPASAISSTATTKANSLQVPRTPRFAETTLPMRNHLRDRARLDLYLAQLRSQSAPNTPVFGGPKSPALSHFAMSPRHPPAAYRNLSYMDESNPFTPGGRVAEPSSQFPGPSPGFKLQPPPSKAPSATPKLNQAAFHQSRTSHSSPSSAESPMQPSDRASNEPTYDAVPIPGAYTGAAVGKPPPILPSYGQSR